jgi:hypothetical protein
LNQDNLIEDEDAAAVACQSGGTQAPKKSLEVIFFVERLYKEP